MTDHTQMLNNLGTRLRFRKDILSKRKYIVDMSFGLALTGIVLVIVDTELIINDVTVPNSDISLSLRILTSVTTAGLLVSIFAYHVIGLRLTTSQPEWKILLIRIKWMKLLFEMLLCVFHPVPYLDIPIDTISIRADQQTREPSKIPVNTILTFLMFLRLYLVGRFIVVHSKLFLDTSVQSLGALSRVKINAQFVFRALMSARPGVVLTTIMVATFFINTWNLRLCEVNTKTISNNTSDGNLSNFGEAMWLTAVTFLTLGYGDIVPYSYCGRLVAGWTGLMGVGIMALSVAVLAKHLEQSRSEKYVYAFVQQISLDKKRRDAAANVIKQMIKIHRLKKTNAGAISIVRHKGKMLRYIQVMHDAQFLKGHVQDCTVGPVELAKGINDTQAMVKLLQDEQHNLAQRIAGIEAMSLSMNNQLMDIKRFLLEKFADP